MSNSQPSNVKFWVFATLILLATAGGISALWPVALEIARSQSDNLVQAGAQTKGGEAEANYHLATWLNSANTAAYVGLARTQIANGHPDEALATLNRAGQGSEVGQLQVRTLIELGRTSAAADAATALTTPNATGSDLVLAGLAYALAGRTADTSALIPRLSSPEAAQRLRRAQAGQLTLAAELYASGLLKSSSALLVKLPTSFERNLLLGHIHYIRHTPSDLAQAATLLAATTAINPSDTETHRLLAQVYADQNQPAAAAQQSSLAAKLQAGRP